MSDPTTLGSYTVESVVYRGPLATSYLAAHTVMRGQRVVLRVLNPDVAADPARVARFEEEARAAAKLKHECIAGVVDMQRDGDQLFLVLEYAEGLDVSTLLGTFGAMPPTVSAAIARDVLRAFEHTHALGMMHGKLRPRRVKVSPDGGVKVLGLGVRDGDAGAEDERDAAYVSPELVGSGSESVAGDLYSVGMLLHNMLAGRVPTGGARPTSLADANPIIPRPLSDLVDHLLESRPDHRPADAKAARAALDDVLESMRVGVGSDLLRDYLANPNSFAAKAKQAALTSLINIARDLNDGPPPDPMAARKVLERVLQVDPGNESAVAFLHELEGGDDRTMMMSYESAPKPAAAPPPAPKPAPAPPPPPAPKPEVKSDVKPAAPKPEPRPEVKPAAAKSAPPPPPPAPKAAPAPAPAQRKAAPAAVPATPNHKPLLFGIGALLVVVVIAIVVVMNGKKNPSAEAPAEAAAPVTASLDVSTEPTGAYVTVQVGGESKNATSNTTFDGLADGTALVKVELAGYTTRETTVAVTAGSAQSLHVALSADVTAQVCSLYVTVKPRADKVLVNGKPAVGKDASFAAALPAGKYKVEASAAGFTSALASGKAAGGEVKRIALTLASAPANVTPPPAPVAASAPVVPATADPADGIAQSITVVQKSDIYVDHVLRAQGATQVDVKLPPGKHEVVFENPDFIKVRREFQLKAGKSSKPIRVDLAAGEGGISVRGGKPGLRIFIDDKSTGVTTPGVVRGIKPGRHKIELRDDKGGAVIATQSVIVADSPNNQPVQF